MSRAQSRRLLGRLVGKFPCPLAGAHVAAIIGAEPLPGASNFQDSVCFRGSTASDLQDNVCFRVLGDTAAAQKDLHIIFCVTEDDVSSARHGVAVTAEAFQSQTLFRWLLNAAVATVECERTVSQLSPDSLLRNARCASCHTCLAPASHEEPKR